MRFMKFLSLITIIALSMGLSSCSSFRSELNSRDDHKIADTRFQEIIDALDNKDSEALKKMFSTNALKEAYDIDGSISYLMGLYQGKVISKEPAYSGKGSKNNGEKTSELDCMYLVTTDKDKYLVFFIDKIVDTENPNNVGLYMLQIIKQSDREKEFDWGGDKTRKAGIYRPDK
jgi:hypothetical protein